MNLETDLTIDEELKEKEAEAFRVFLELAPSCDEGMEPSFVRYAYDMKKATFYFKSDHRVDFRELVKQLNSRLGISVEMRQIGDREQASLVGGLGPCGQVLCCCRLGNDCCQKNATIKMAKNQNLSLNPTKISGMCGRLMCCLRFENDFYKDFKDRAPKINAQVKTPDGIGKVVAVDALHDLVSVKIDEEKPRQIAVADFKEGSSAENGWKVGRSVWEEAGKALADLTGSAANVTIDTSLFTGNDHMVISSKAKLASKPATQDNNKKESKPHRRRSRRTSSKDTHSRQIVTAKRPGGNSSGIKHASAPKEKIKIERHPHEERKPRRRRTTTINTNKD